jgi:hypothetical protein
MNTNSPVALPHADPGAEHSTLKSDGVSRPTHSSTAGEGNERLERGIKNSSPPTIKKNSTSAASLAEEMLRTPSTDTLMKGILRTSSADKVVEQLTDALGEPPSSRARHRPPPPSPSLSHCRNSANNAPPH